MPDPFDPTSYDAAPPFDLQSLMQAGTPASAPPPAPVIPQGRDKRKWLRLLPVLAAAAKGGPGMMEGLLAGYQQADARRRQQAAQDATTQRQDRIDAETRQYRQATLANQQAQIRQQQERQREADRRAFVNDVRTAVGSMTSAEAVRSLLPLYTARAQALGIPTSELEAFILESATPTVLQQRAAKARLAEADELYGKQAGDFSYDVPGEPKPVSYTELQRRAGFIRNPPHAAITYAQRFPETKGLPIGSDPLPLTAGGAVDLDTATNVLNRMGVFRAPRGRAQRGPTSTETRQALAALDEEVAFLLRSAARGTSPADAGKRWGRLARDYAARGIAFDARRDAIRAKVERDLRTAEPLDALDTVGVEAPPASPPGGRGAGAAPPAPPRTATRAEVQAVAAQLQVSVEEATRQLEARGVRVVP